VRSPSVLTDLAVTIFLLLRSTLPPVQLPLLPIRILSSAVGLSVPVQAESCRERAHPHPMGLSTARPPLPLARSFFRGSRGMSHVPSKICGDAQGRSRLYTGLKSLIWPSIDLRRRFWEPQILPF